MIPFNKPHMTGKELWNIALAHANGHLAGDGSFTKRCQDWLESITGTCRALLTHSCTASLEMAAILADIREGDEVIMPSYTFVSTANAVVLRGGVPVFIDIRRDTLNLDETLIEQALTPKTKAIIPVHYAGVGCEMDPIMSLAAARKLLVIEDAAQGFMSSYKGRQLGNIGHLGALSFHETKNIISGEGGALLVNDKGLIERAEIVREKGTDRSKFFRGEVDKYTWQDIGSSYLPSDLVAAFLWAQIEEARNITDARLSSWGYYHDLLRDLGSRGKIRLPIIPDHCQHNAHMYYVLLAASIDRALVLERLKERGINAIFHYVPLHSSPAGARYGKVSGELRHTIDYSSKIIRLPLWKGITPSDQEKVVDCLEDAVASF